MHSDASPTQAPEQSRRIEFETIGPALRIINILILAIIILGPTHSDSLGQNVDSVVATVNGKAITQKDIDDSVSEKILPLQQQLYALRKVALDNLVSKELIESEAKRQNISVEELRRSMVSGPINVNREEVEATYLQNQSFFAAMSPDEAKERLRLDLETQQRMKHYRASLELLRKSASLVVNFPPPPISSSFDDGTSPAIGPKSAAVTILEFSDFECPFCRAVQVPVKQILAEYADKVRFVFKHLPLDGHKNALAAARASFCAGQQDRFWQYQDALFSANNLSPETFNKLAEDLGLNTDRFRACANSVPSINAITKDLELAKRLRLESTPSFIINGQMVNGAIGIDEFRRLINKELGIQGSNKSSSTN